MKAGAMDRKITLKHRVLTRSSASGEEVVTYTEYATVWARKVPRDSRRFFAAQQMNAELAEMFDIRYRTDVLATDQIEFEGASYRIVPPAEIGRREGLSIQATAVPS